MKSFKLTAATAILAVVGSAALADTTAMADEDLIRTRDITGGNIYRMDVDVNDTMWRENDAYASVDAEWNTIGEIEDIVLNKDGQMIGIIAEIGGFLDIGDKHVMIPVENIRLTAVDDQTYGYVTNKTEEELEAMEAVDEAFWN
ncbi:PRC-barrel domain-containing protein [Yoonia sp. SDW83-1]|uniref:PRC-barrel domain-containing protein n=1 Tax=Yoonia sp. SDW83-1 TaxID=3366945 RepID=UPI00398C569C